MGFLLQRGGTHTPTLLQRLKYTVSRAFARGPKYFTGDSENFRYFCLLYVLDKAFSLHEIHLEFKFFIYIFVCPLISSFIKLFKNSMSYRLYTVYYSWWYCLGDFFQVLLQSLVILHKLIHLYKYFVINLFIHLLGLIIHLKTFFYAHCR